MTLVSVVVPAFNAAPYIDSAVQSMRDQTIQDLEIIVVDDGSADDTAAIAAQHAEVDGRVRVIRRDSPSGRPGSARNDGVRLARGKYVAFLDADDFSTPDRLAVTLAALRRTDARLCFSDYRRYHDDTGTYDIAPALVEYAFLERAESYLVEIEPGVVVTRETFVGFLCAILPIVAPSTVTLERSLLLEEDYCFDESLMCGEDQDLWLRLAARTSFAYVAKPLTFFRKHGGSLTASRHIQTVTDVTAVLRMNLARFQTRLSAVEIASTRSRIATALRDIGYDRWVCGDTRGARRAFLDSWHHRRSVAAAKGFAKALVPRAFSVQVASHIGVR